MTEPKFERRQTLAAFFILVVLVFWNLIFHLLRDGIVKGLLNFALSVVIIGLTVLAISAVYKFFTGKSL